MRNLSQIAITLLPIFLYSGTSAAVTLSGDELQISGTSTNNYIISTDGANTTSISNNPLGITEFANDAGSVNSSSVNLDPTDFSIGVAGPAGGTNFAISTTGPTPGARTAIYDSTGNYNFQQTTSTGTSFGATGSAGESTLVDFSTSGVSIGTTGPLDLSSTSSISVSGVTNINSSGANATSIGGSGTGAVTLISGSNSLKIDNSGINVVGSASLNGATNNIGTSQASTNSIGTYSGSTNTIGGTESTNVILGSTSINSTGTSGTDIGNTTGALSMSGSTVSVNGNTNINTTGTSNTNIGNTTGNVDVAGSSITVGSNSGSTVTLGSSSGNSTISMNGNRIQNVANAVAGTDAVNLNQLNASQSNLQSEIQSVQSNLQNQINTTKYGVSGVMAVANIPALEYGKNFSVGVGYGSFNNANAAALGANVRLVDALVMKVSGSTAGGSYTAGAGLGLSF